MAQDQHPPSITAGRLSERTSAKGNTYLTGYFGPLRIVALKTDQKDDYGNPIWTLKFSENPPREKQADAASPAPKQREPQKADAKRDWQRPSENAPTRSTAADDLIPF